MIRTSDLLDATHRDLSELLAAGHPVRASALDDTEYRGTSLGLPSFLERLTWKTFRKTFHRDPDTGLLRGWNVRLAQRGLSAPSEPLMKGGAPMTFGHYVVIEPRTIAAPVGCDRGLVLDYSRGQNGRWSPLSLVRDPIVALKEDDPDLLLGWTYLQLGTHHVGTPSFFTLEREGPLSFRAPLGRPPLRK
jgi:hypothetical protein